MRRRVDVALPCALAMIAALPLVAAREARAQDAPRLIIRGVVVDTSGQPVVMAQVSADRERSTRTDSTGAFALRLRGEAPNAIDVRRIGYVPVRASLGVALDSALRVVLVPVGAAMDPVASNADRTVRALEVRGFYDRLREKERGANTGHFLTPEDVEQRRTSKVSILVDGIPGVRIVPYKPCDRCTAFLALFSTARCPMTVYLDGTRLNPLNQITPVDIDNVITARDISAVEVYTRSNVPDRYRSLSGSCGVVLLWTR